MPYLCKCEVTGPNNLVTAAWKPHTFPSGYQCNRGGRQTAILLEHAFTSRLGGTSFHHVMISWSRAKVVYLLIFAVFSCNNFKLSFMAAVRRTGEGGSTREFKYSQEISQMVRRSVTCIF